MRIAQLAPLFESVPPKLYGGTERVVSYVVEELVRLGHDVTLFASGDSLTTATLFPIGEQALRLDPGALDRLSPHVLLMERVLQHRASFDVIHSHIDGLPFPFLRRLSTPSVSTLHGRLDFPELQLLYNEFAEMPVVSISNAQRAPLPQANWQATVYHGLPTDLFRYENKQGSYLAFLGRLSREKRVDRAVEIARRAGMPLKVAAKVDPIDADYYKTVAEPLLQDPSVDYIGEINEATKGDFLSKAYALLFPIDWPEPFGMVLIEAMACGTPVITYDGGSVREIITPGVTGFIVNTLEEAVEAVAKVPSLSRRAIRDCFEERFTASRMAKEYLKIYERLLDERRTVGIPLMQAWDAPREAVS